MSGGYMSKGVYVQGVSVRRVYYVLEVSVGGGGGGGCRTKEKRSR